MQGRGRSTWGGALTLGLFLLGLAACGNSGGAGDGGDGGNGGSAEAGTAGPDGVELCGNTTDDDGDGEPDCSDPDCLAVAADPTQPTTFADTVAWLHAPAGNGGCGPLQEGVAPGALIPGRVAVLRGRVSNVDGQPLAGASVRVVGSPEYGSTHSRGDGLFDIAVNGGGKVTLEITGPEYLVVHRRAGVPSNDFAWVEPVVLKARSSVATRLELTGGQASQVMRAEASEDASGRREPTLLFPAGARATARGADGSEMPLDSLNVRLTEFTVGDRGPEAMPADLPASSAYTYAFELSVDEAEAMAATGVGFDQALPIYLENFLGFPAGTPVPVGYYDRQSAEWRPETDGRVIAILGETAGLAEIDLDGDGAPATPRELSAAGFGADEPQRLAELYEPGQSLWRVPVNHFSSYDFNWAFGFPDDVASPPVMELPGALTDSPGCAEGSILRVDNRTLGESLAIAGTGYGLYYQSDRTPGGQTRSLDIEIAGPSVPASLKHIDATLTVAGNIHQAQIEASPFARFQYTWDGRNAYGRPLQGAQPYTLRIGYVYDGVYSASERADRASFAQPGTIELTGSKTREEVSSVREVRGTLGAWDARGHGLGGFSLDVHHAYDPAARTLYFGDGRQRSAETVPPIVTNVFPGSELTPSEPLALDDGTLLFVSGEVIYRFADGQLAPFAGGGTPVDGLGDGGPALDAALSSPRRLTQGPDGSIYFWSGARVRRVNPAGQIDTLVGGGPNLTFNEGVGALEIDPISPRGLAVSANGLVHFVEAGAFDVWRVSAEGRIELVGGGSQPGDGIPARDANLFGVSGLAFGPTGELFVSMESGDRIRRIDADGIITTIAGTGNEANLGDGGPASDASLDDPRDIELDAEGNLIIGQIDGRIRIIGIDGLIDTLVEVGTSGDISVGPDGAIYAGVSNGTIVKVAPSLPRASFGDLIIAAEDGSEVYRFNALGRHLSTVDALTGTELRRFEYDAEGRLASVIEENVRATSIARNAEGAPIAIVSPYGVRTELAVNGDGYLERVTDAAGQGVALEYAAEGLLTALVDERGGRHEYAYDANGRLISDRDPTGATQTLTPGTDNQSLAVEHTTALGRVTRHERVPVPTGVEQRVTSPGGATSVSLRNDAGNVTVTAADGTTLETVYGADPRFGAIAPISAETRVTLPSGLESIVRQVRVAELTNVVDPLSLTRLQHETDINGRVFTSEYDATTRTLVQRTPEGRELSLILDERGRLSEARAPGLLSTFYEYDPEGRLIAVSSGEGADQRRTSVVHTPEGWVGSVTDALGQSTQYGLDAIGRATSTLYADGTTTSFAYDAASNLTALTPPGQTPHGLQYDARNQLIGYLPPELPTGATPTAYAYDADRELTTLSLPGLDPITYAYTPAGLLSTVQHPGGSINLTYDTAERLITSQSPDGVTLAYEYDGALPTATTWSGPIAGTVAATHDDNLFVTALSVNDTAVTYAYDDDGLITRAGALTLTHDPATALLTSTSAGDLAGAYGYNTRGELTTQTVTGEAGALYAFTQTYDALGRIASTSETLDATTTTTAYAYDAVGQLVEVTTNGTLTAAYDYDEDGNRLNATVSGTTAAAAYDAQERLLTYGDTTYTYTPRGSLQTRATAGATTNYTHDALGNLTAVALPDGRNVTYLIDAENRRVGKAIDGTLQRGWLYQNALNPIAELDATGAVTSRFVYASKANVPDLMIQAGTTYALISDVRGSMRLVVNTATSAVVQRIDYGPFGEVTADSNPGFQPFGFAGGLYDPDTSLVRFGARDYDAAVGRWTDKDPIGFGGGQNLYGYVGNDPVNFVDPGGEIPALLIKLAIDAAKEAALDAAIQYATKGCINGGQVARAAALGALSGGVGRAARGLRRASSGAKPLKQQAAELVPQNGGRSRVTLDTPSRRIEVDLTGKAHGGIETPHTKVSLRNEQAPDHLQPVYNTRKSEPVPSTQEDIRTVRRYLERQGK